MEKNDIVINCDDIMTTDGYDVQPQFIEMRFDQNCIQEINKAISVLVANPGFDSIILTSVDWHVDDEYAGKPRSGKLIVRMSSDERPIFTFRFINEWTGTEYYVDLLEEIAQPLILDLEAA
jgi:hypothetical protein